MPQPYDVNQLYAEMELELTRSYHRNMARHTQEEIAEGFNWDMWQQLKLQDLQAYKKEARVIINKYTHQATKASTGAIVDSYGEGANAVDEVLRGIRKRVTNESFFRTNRRKLDALLDAINNDFEKAGVATLRKIEDEYRKIIFKAQLMYNAGASTLFQAVDTAAKDFLQSGITAIRYSNGARVNIASYAEMCLRTSAKKAFMTGEGAKQAEWGEYLTQISSYGACSPLCLPWQGKVYVNDVYAGGKPDEVHPLLSTAMENGLFHPNCRHRAMPYFDGISYPAEAPNTETTLHNYAMEQEQRGIERNIRKYKRVKEGSLDPANRAKAQAKIGYWQGRMREHLEENPQLRRNSAREKLR